MSNDCIVKLTGNGQSADLYLGCKGNLAQAGAKVALCARQLQEAPPEMREANILDKMSGFLTVGSGLDFRPVPLNETNLADLPHYYHIYVTSDNDVGIEYRKDGSGLKRLNLPSFIRKVNKARCSANYPYKMLRQPLSPQPVETSPRPYTLIEREQIAQTIIDQMGGLGPLRAMIGASNFMALDSPAGLKFDFKGCPASTHDNPTNKCQVVYNPDQDTYDLEFYYYTPARYSHCPKVHSVEGIYFDMLQDLFTGFTGLFLTL